MHAKKGEREEETEEEEDWTNNIALCRVALITRRGRAIRFSPWGKVLARAALLFHSIKGLSSIRVVGGSLHLEHDNFPSGKIK